MTVREQIDARCDEFEEAWQTGVPSLEEFLRGVDDRGRDYLLRDLVAVELHYRRARGEPTSEDALLAAHPGLRSELPHALRRARILEQRRPVDAASTQAHVPAESSAEATVDQPAKPGGSRGLHIRCPHCTSPVELVADTPFESVTCDSCGSAFQLVDREDGEVTKPLQNLGRFELISRLGMGGFGTVWKARDTELDRTVAVKIPRKGQLEPHELELFFREARAAAQLRHPNIVQVHEVGREGEMIYIVSDLVRGVDLSDWFSETAPNFRSMAGITATIADALQHAHEHGVIHRDLKPANILVDEAGVPHLMDFGLAKREAGEMTMTLDGQILGTPSYMSPEQARGEGHWTDARTDIYSLGVILFHMLTGELPFRGNAHTQIQQRLEDDAPDPRRLNRFIPRDLATICEKCLQRDPNGRYSTARDVSQELGRYLNGEPIHARPISRVQRGVRWARRKPAQATAAALVVFLAVAGPAAAIVIELQRSRLDEENAEQARIINEFNLDRTQRISESTELRDELDWFQGRTNPYEGGPPIDPISARKSLLSGLVSEHGAKLDQQLDRGKYNVKQAIAANLALGILYDELARSDDARGHYREAIDLLERLIKENVKETEYQRALADAYLRLARLEIQDERQSGIELLEKARSIHERLAQENNDLRLQADWFETELLSGAAAGFAGGAEHVLWLAEVKQELERDYAASPIELYELACLFGGREAILKNADAAADVDSGGQPTTVSTD